MNQILCTDALSGLCELPDNSIQMCVTSPPYYGLRDYGVDGQIGVEETPAEYIRKLTMIFRELRRALKKDGTLWINIADSYGGSSKGAWIRPVSERPKSKQIYHFDAQNIAAQMPNRWEDIKAKDMIGIPWSLAFALRSDGWYLRSDIIWEKPNCLPEPVKDRPTKSYEHLFLFSKSPHYYYNYTAITEPITSSTAERNKRAISAQNKYANGLPDGTMQAIFKPRSCTQSNGRRNKRDVWRICTNSYRANGHFAVFPEKLIEPCILAGCPVGGCCCRPVLWVRYYRCSCKAARQTVYRNRIESCLL